MIIAKNNQQLEIARSSLQGSVALVATMGNLHKGHLALVRRAKSEADHVIVTIYINPMQFSANEDLDTYPRTLDEDIQHLEDLAVDLLFTPDDSEIYPDSIDQHTQVVVPDLSFLYCGASREGHFQGVTTIVCKLFNLTRPDVAIFGAKDFQQLTIIQKMVTDLAMPIKLIGIPTYREDSGLAMSSRNKYLSTEEKKQAANLYKKLCWARDQLMSGHTNYCAIETEAKSTLEEKGFCVEFFTICQRDSLAPATVDDKKLVILTACQYGKPRLIDNITINLA